MGPRSNPVIDFDIPQARLERRASGFGGLRVNSPAGRRRLGEHTHSIRWSSRYIHTLGHIPLMRADVHRGGDHIVSFCREYNYRRVPNIQSPRLRRTHAQISPRALPRALTKRSNDIRSGRTALDSTADAMVCHCFDFARRNKNASKIRYTSDYNYSEF